MAINEVNHRFRQKGPEVVDYMVKFVTQVDTEIDAQTRAQIEQLKATQE